MKHRNFGAFWKECFNFMLSVLFRKCYNCLFSDSLSDLNILLRFPFIKKIIYFLRIELFGSLWHQRCDNFLKHLNVSEGIILESYDHLLLDIFGKKRLQILNQNLNNLNLKIGDSLLSYLLVTILIRYFLYPYCWMYYSGTLMVLS